ncbi:hypothetical protein K432DRAFT_408882 [Lepidopterella palustris CBS 459.81]|uniref:Uncharacterized protein n=1 Tax=Lepidopterella palustris CBS 459.81 TaxID=1314670 RepID=A0A8E2E1P9_9PEZI|nr:hypothetical protein K432DRAFT_408882 [Lepidopterella palustris CBS 459.81]
MNPAGIVVSGGFAPTRTRAYAVLSDSGRVPACCTLCKPINLDNIIETGINLPLKPYLTAWKYGLDSENQRGLCALILNSFSFKLKYRLSDMDTLFLKFNKYHDAIVVAASNEEFIKASIHLDLLCGPDGNHWLMDETNDRLNFACGFLRANCGFGKGEHESGAFKHRIASPSSGSDECLGLAVRWLEECCESHLPKCQKANADFIPTRLVDVGRNPKQDTVKLVSLQESDHLGDSRPIKYAALSYCWWTTPFLTTTSLNPKDMYNSIPLSRLPATI